MQLNQSMDNATAFKDEALRKYPNFFKEQGKDLLHRYKNGWRRVKPLSSRYARIEGFSVVVVISEATLKRVKV